MESSSSTGDQLPSSVQLQSALDQLTYMQRLLNGDDEMSLSDLLASTSASGPSASLPSGGLSKALAALLSPLLPSSRGSEGGAAYSFAGSGGLSQSQQALLAKRAAFQPRRYLEMTNELVSRISDPSSEMFRAVELAQRSLNETVDLDASRERKRQRILGERRKRKLAAETMTSQQNVREEACLAAAAAATTNANGQQNPNRIETFAVMPSFYFPSALHGKAKEQEPHIITKSLSRQDLLNFIQAWQMELQDIYLEATSKVDLSLQEFTEGKEGGKVALLRMKIDQVGCAWLWVNFAPAAREEGEIEEGRWFATISRLNLLAESEVAKHLEEGREIDSPSMALQTSLFPLYRRVTLLLHSKLASQDVQRGNPWSHAIAALFALVTLCRLHDIQQPGDFTSSLGGAGIAALHGQEAVLNALIHFSIAPEEVVETDKETTTETVAMQTTQSEEQASSLPVPLPLDPPQAQAEEQPQAEHSPQSALFSDSQVDIDL